MLCGAQIAVSGGGMQHRNETLLRTIRSASLFPPQSGLFCACRCATHRWAHTVSAHCGGTGHRSRMAWQSLAAVARGRQPAIASAVDCALLCQVGAAPIPAQIGCCPVGSSTHAIRTFALDTERGMLGQVLPVLSEANTEGTYQATGLCFRTGQQYPPSPSSTHTGAAHVFSIGLDRRYQQAKRAHRHVVLQPLPCHLV
jgi:hypothetical protein